MWRGLMLSTGRLHSHLLMSTSQSVPCLKAVHWTHYKKSLIDYWWKCSHRLTSSTGKSQLVSHSAETNKGPEIRGCISHISNWHAWRCVESAKHFGMILDSRRDQQWTEMTSLQTVPCGHKVYIKIVCVALRFTFSRVVIYSGAPQLSSVLPLLFTEKYIIISGP